MSTPAVEAPAASRLSASRVIPSLLLTVVAMAVLAVLGMAIGTNPISPLRVIAGLFGDDAQARTIVVGNRLPRVVLSILVGAALGLAGHLMQSLTRNPLADPGLLGIQAGAAAAVVSSIAFLHVATPSGYVWFALIGAAVGALVGYGLATGGSAASPVRLVLAGSAITACLYSYVSGVLVIDPYTFSRFRFWELGSLTTRSLSVVGDVVWFLVIGVILAIGMARALDVVALGRQAAVALGARPAMTQALGIAGVVLLTGAATAAVGPIAFVGLAVPHLSRALVGAGHQVGLPMSALLGALMLQAADVLGRVIAWPQEVGAGIVSAVVGAPVLIWFVRRGRVVRL